MSQKVWEVEIRVLMDGEEESVNLFFPLFPTEQDVVNVLEHKFNTCISDTWTEELFEGARKVIDCMVTEWFEVGVAGGRPSHHPETIGYIGYVQVFDHEMFDNTDWKKFALKVEKV